MNEWETYYQTDAEPQSRQNARITRDFAAAVRGAPLFVDVLTSSFPIVEIGCGTGELSAMLAREFRAWVTGIDISETAITTARKQFGDVAYFAAMDFDGPSSILRGDLVVSSNTLEHFTAWREVLDRWLQIAPRVLLIVPYRETWPMGENDTDGGRAHVTTFSEDSFDAYRVLDWFTFASDGWLMGDNPRQLAILIEAE
jgi:SAM-dependent methyltransferase